MKPSLDKLYKFFKLEIERGCDNHAVVGGFERMLDRWGNEARADSLPEDLIQVIVSRLQDYARLSPTSRAEALEGLWKRIQRNQGIKAVLPPFELPEAPSRAQPQPAQTTPRRPEPESQEDTSTPHRQSPQPSAAQPGPELAIASRTRAGRSHPSRSQANLCDKSACSRHRACCLERPGHGSLWGWPSKCTAPGSHGCDDLARHALLPSTAVQ